MSANFMNQMNGVEMVFWGLALAGTLFFVVRVILMLIGFGHGDVTSGAGHDLAADAGSADATHASSEALFRLFSVNSLLAFFMMLGWTGLTCYKQFNMSPSISWLIGTAVGILCMYITATLFAMSRKLASSGSAFKVADTVGLKAQVYQQIPAGGKGRVQVNVAGGLTRELDAVSAGGEAIASFTTVEIVGAVDDNTVRVKKSA